jgi:serine/threonine-protein kinase
MVDVSTGTPALSSAPPTPQRSFHVLREIASGGFGSVFLARLVQTDGFSRIVAIKLLHPQWSENVEVASRMRDEARLLGLLRHKNIVDVLDLTHIDNRVAVVMEYLEAVDVKAIGQYLDRKGERMPLTASMQIIAQAASALDAAYNKAPYQGEKPLRVVHRDIKPSNLMLDAQGTVKVLDFGVARADFDAREAETKGMAFGSFDYMPSERRFMESGGETSDVYSLGAVLYEIVAGAKIGKGRLKPAAHAQWVKEQVGGLRAQLSGPAGPLDEFAELLTSMLAFSADDRPRPADVVSSLRRLAREVRDGSLEEWAEDHVPAMLTAHRAQQDRKAAHPLVGKNLAESRVIEELIPRAEAPEAPAGSTPPPAPAERTPPQPPMMGAATPSQPPAPSVAANTQWVNSDIPKRVRDAAPARPPITGTVTPAPLRRKSTPDRPPPIQPVPSGTPGAAPVGERPDPPGRRPARSAGSNVAFYGLVVVGMLVLVVGAATFLAVLAVTAAQ